MRGRARHGGSAVGLAAAALLLPACSGSAKPAAAPAPAPTLPPSPCPSASVTTAEAWPKGIPSSVPRIPTAVMGPVTQMQSITYVRFTTSQSLRDGVVFIVKALPDAGFTVGRGDAEATEADAPFSSPDLLGSLRLTIVTDCTTAWLLAVRPRDALTQPGPLIPYTPGVSASPLPAPTVSALPFTIGSPLPFG